MPVGAPQANCPICPDSYAAIPAVGATSKTMPAERLEQAQGLAQAAAGTQQESARHCSPRETDLHKPTTPVSLLRILRRRCGGRILPSRRRLLQELPPSCIAHIIRAQELDKIIIGRALRRGLLRPRRRLRSRRRRLLRPRRLLRSRRRRLGCYGRAHEHADRQPMPPPHYLRFNSRLAILGSQPYSPNHRNQHRLAAYPWCHPTLRTTQRYPNLRDSADHQLL